MWPFTRKKKYANPLSVTETIKKDLVSKRDFHLDQMNRYEKIANQMNALMLEHERAYSAYNDTLYKMNNPTLELAITGFEEEMRTEFPIHSLEDDGTIEENTTETMINIVNESAKNVSDKTPKRIAKTG